MQETTVSRLIDERMGQHLSQSAVAAPSHSAGLRPVVLMVGMHLRKTRGGISTLTNAILDSELSDSYEFRYLASQAEDHGAARKLLLAISAYLRFAWACVFDRPSLVYVHVGSNASLYREGLFVLIAKFFQLPALTHFHAGDIDHYYPRQPSIGKRLIKHSLSVTDRIIAVSESSARQLRDLVDTGTVCTLTNAIDTTLFRTNKVKSGSKKIRLLFIGAVGKLKGERDLLRAVAMLKETGRTNVLFSIVGYGAETLREYCDELGIADQIEHLGPVSMSERISFFKNADIFVLPTYAEAMPISVIEAMAAGLPVITTPVGGIPEIIDDGADGLLTACGDVEALAEKMGLLVGDPELRSRMGAHAQRTAHSRFEMSVYLDSLSSNIKSTIKASTGLRLVVRRTLKSCTATLMPRRASSRSRQGSVTIFAYHRVVADIAKAEQETYHGLVVSAATFRKQCEMLSANFSVQPLIDVLNALANGDVTERTAVITFDDGYRDNYEQAFPILRELNLPATVFVPTRLIGRAEPLAHDRIHWLLSIAEKRKVAMDKALSRAGLAEAIASKFVHIRPSLGLTETLVYLPYRLRERVIAELEAELGDFPPYPDSYGLLDWDMAREMSEVGISFGAHTMNHAVLTLEDNATIRSEIVGSRTDLERELGAENIAFAYPNGAFNSEIRRLVSETGYAGAVTTNRRKNGKAADRFALGRISLCEESSRGILGSYSSRVSRLRLEA